MAGASRRGLVARQRAAADRLRRQLLGPDGSLRHHYFRDLRRESSRFARALTRAGLVERCARSDIVCIGDFHAVPACQVFAAELLEAMAARSAQLALGVEFVYTRQQGVLDGRQSGRLTDAVFLARMHYREEWGYPWVGFRELLDRARRLGVPVLALDRPPRGGFDGLVTRDEHAARRIAAAYARDPGSRLVVLFGESHVTPAHIPRRVVRRLRRGGLTARIVSVLQDPEPVYWDLLARDAVIPEAAELSEGVYAVFHTSPIDRYEAYRQVLDRWRGDAPSEDEVDLTPAVHHLLSVLRGWLGIRSRRVRIAHGPEWVEDLEDVYPEVYSGPNAGALLIPILEEHGRSPEEIDEATSTFRERGALYESRSNTVFLSGYRAARAAAEGARFLRAALSGRLFEPPDGEPGDPVERAYGGAYNEALAYLGARLVDPAADRVFGGAEVRGGGDGDLARRLAWLEAHRRYELSGRAVPPAEVTEPLRGPRAERRALARELGHRLGRGLLERVEDGRLPARALRSLFTRRLDPPRARHVVVTWLRDLAV